MVLQKTESFLYREILEKYYFDQDHVISVERASGHGVNSENYYLRASHWSVFFKVILKPGLQVKEKLKIWEECFHKDIRVTAIVPNKEGELYVEDKERLFVCFQLCKGETYSGRAEERISAARELAKLDHRLALQSKLIPRSEKYSPLVKDEILKIQGKCQKTDPFEESVSSSLEYLNKLTDSIFSDPSLKQWPQKIQHLDYHPDNVAFAQGSVQAIFDFDSLVSMPQYQGLAFAADRFSKNIDEFVGFLRVYQSFSPDLDDKEIAFIPKLIIKEALERIFYLLRTHFFEESRVWDFEFEKHLKIIQKTQKMEEKFLKRINL